MNRARWIKWGATLSLVVALFFFFSEFMITPFLFFPEKNFWQRPEDYGLSYEDVSAFTEDGVKLHGWFLPAWPSHATVVMFHGNAGNISHRLFKTAPLVKEGISFLLIDYRGFGRSEGTIRKGGDLFADGRATIDWLKKTKGIRSEEIFLFGESIGSAPALKIASSREVRGVILEAPFTTLKELAKKHYPFVPTGLLGSFAFDNLESLAGLKVPLLVIHGKGDEICPFEMGKKLFEAASGVKEMLAVPSAGHNDIVDVAGPEYFSRIQRFVGGLVPPEDEVGQDRNRDEE